MDARQGLSEDLAALGVERGGVLLVHSSFRKLRPVPGGPEAVVDALLDVVGPEGTLVMPTMTDGASPFDPRTTPTYEMGIIAETFWRRPGVVRSPHPGASFAAKGPRAEMICAPHPLSPPHGLESPPGRVHALGGQVLLLGVDHSESTVLHVAESLANVPYSVVHPCVVTEDGVSRVAMIAETDHCCTGFRRMNEWLRVRGLQREGLVGHAPSILARAGDVVEVALEHLRVDPLVFLCAPDAGCEECEAARASVR